MAHAIYVHANVGTNFRGGLAAQYHEGWLRADGSISTDRKDCASFTSVDSANEEIARCEWENDTSVRSGRITAYVCWDGK